MTHFTVDAQTSRRAVCDELDKFQLFSAVSAKIEGNAITLYEVGLGERLRRALASLTGRRDQAAEDSRTALGRLARINPAIGKALGTAISDKADWSASELKGKLKVAAQKLGPSQYEGKWTVKHDGATVGVELGLANANGDQIMADARIQWMMPDARSGDANLRTPIADFADAETGEPPPVQTISLRVNPPDLGAESIRERYRSAIERCRGHVVIEPIPDLQLQHPKDRAMQGKSSDLAIDALLAAIDEVRASPHSRCTAITIAAGRVPGLADQVWDRKALRDKLGQEASVARDRATAPAQQAAARPGIHPHAGRSAPVTPGLHFLVNLPLELDAERILVPASMARAQGMTSAGERGLASAPGTGGMQLVGMTEDVADSAALTAHGKVQDRYRALLQGVDGRVVLYPVATDQQSIEEMVRAAWQACEDNRQLAVAFAVPDRGLQRLVASAWEAVIAEQDSPDLDEDDLPTAQWKEV